MEVLVLTYTCHLYPVRGCYALRWRVSINTSSFSYLLFLVGQRVLVGLLYGAESNGVGMVGIGDLTCALGMQMDFGHRYPHKYRQSLQKIIISSSQPRVKLIVADSTTVGIFSANWGNFWERLRSLIAMSSPSLVLFPSSFLALST